MEDLFLFFGANIEAMEHCFHFTSDAALQALLQPYFKCGSISSLYYPHVGSTLIGCLACPSNEWTCDFMPPV